MRLARTIFFKRRRGTINTEITHNNKQTMYLNGGGSSSGWKLQLSNGQGSSSHTQKSEEYTRKQLKAYQDLYNEVRQAPPLGILSYKVKCDIENLCSDKDERRLLVSKVHRESGCSPLFIACKKGNIEIVEYLLSHCDADVEQKGLYEVQDDRTVHHVSPLWCAR